MLYKPKNQQLQRRDFIKCSAATIAGLSLLPSFRYINGPGYPFTLGVASGDPLPDSVVLWTRLAPEPLDRSFGISADEKVSWELSKFPDFKTTLQKGSFIATSDMAHAVHIEVYGLTPNTTYYYRFKHKKHISPVGRTKTAPALDAENTQFNFVLASCQNYENGLYTAYDHMVEEDIDVVFFMGDYIYEYGANPKAIRQHVPSHEIKTLEDYRIRYAQYKSDPSLQAAHAAFPWIVALDDHEVKNNWGGDGPPYDDNSSFLERRKAAFKAFYEHMPLRQSSIPQDINMKIYRKFNFGKLAEINVLDTRQYRTDFACFDETKENCSSRFDPSRTMLGEQQENWLFSNLKQSSSTWNILAQQVHMAQVDKAKGDKQSMSMDSWDGYVATRKKLFDVVKKNEIKNFVVLTGDSHKNWLNDLIEDFENPKSAILGTEIMGTSISSRGDGSDLPEIGKTILAENSHIKFYNDQRGYVKCSVTPYEYRTEYRVVPYVSQPGASISTRAVFVTKNNVPGAQRIEDKNT